MTADFRLTRTTAKVLLALAEQPQAWRYGYDLSRQTGLKSGTLYPLLMRLAERGWLQTRWEDSGLAGRPPRHMYRLTGDGQAQAAALAAPDARLRWSAAS